MDLPSRELHFSQRCWYLIQTSWLQRTNFKHSSLDHRILRTTTLRLFLHKFIKIFGQQQLVGLWRILNLNLTESGTFSEIRRILTIRSRRIQKFFWSNSKIKDVIVEVRLNNSTGTLIDRGLLCLYFYENNHNYFNCSLLVRLQLLNFNWLSWITVSIVAGNFNIARQICICIHIRQILHIKSASDGCR